MAPPPTSNPAPPPEPPFLQVQDGLLEKIFLPTAMMPPLPAPSSHQTPLPVLSIADIPDVLLEEIFLRLPSAADLACVSTARSSFRRVISDHAFLRRYRALHPPPLIGMLLVPAQPPHPSAVPARAFVGFDFSCSSFLPSTAGRSWSPINFFDGRALLSGAPVEEKSGRRILVGSDEICDWDYRNFLVRDLAVCDPVHRRYILLPTVPGDLKALIRRPDLLSLETFLAPGEDDKDPLSFRVLCLAECRMNLLLLTFSSLHGQWHVLTYNQWSADSTFASFQNYESGLCKRQFVHGRFYWHLHFQNELLVLDVCTMKFSAVDLPSEQLGNNSFVIVETTDGTLGMLTRGFDEDSVDDRYWLTYSIMRNNQWHFEKIIRLPVKRAILVGVAGGYLIIEAVYTTSSQDEPKFGYFSVDLKTLQVELFAALSKPIYPGRLYAGFPPSLCAPTI